MDSYSLLKTEHRDQQFATHDILDQQHRGIVAAAFEHSRGWRAQSQVVWNFQHTSQPLLVFAGAFNPNGAEMVEFFPLEGYYWLQPNSGFETPGQNNRGLICLPPMSAGDVMTRYAIPKYRGNLQNLRVIGMQPVPNLAERLRVEELNGAPSEGFAVRIEYAHNNHPFEEEFYACRYQLTAPPAYGAGGMISQINWGLARFCSFRAERGKLDTVRPTFWRVAASLRVNPAWKQICDQVMQQMNGQFNAHIQSWQAKMQSEAQTQQRLTEYYAHSHQQRQQQQNEAWAIEQRQRQEPSTGGYTAQQAWRDELGGVTAYNDPDSSHGNVLYHTSQDQYVWRNEQGTIYGTNDPGENPNDGSTHNWQRLNEAYKNK